MKTNKSFTKRLKVTKNKKIVSRKPNQNHFRAKKSGSRKMSMKRTGTIYLTNRARRQYLVNAKT